jgi:hypothetical protein
MNYAEQIARLYLRLNGFFLIENFVQHKVDEGIHSADVDILAMRMPHSHELIERVELQRDSWFEQNKIDIANSCVGLIIEVKSGDCRCSDIKAFSPDRLRYSLRMLGFFNSENLEIAIQELRENSIFIQQDKVIVKLVISENTMEGDWKNLQLECVDTFIRNRVRDFNQYKWANRILFPNQIMQYIIWQDHQQRRE